METRIWGNMVVHPGLVHQKSLLLTTWWQKGVIKGLKNSFDGVENVKPDCVGLGVVGKAENIANKSRFFFQKFGLEGRRRSGRRKKGYSVKWRWLEGKKL